MAPGERAVSFGTEADSYDAARPGYPAQAAEHVLGLTTVSKAVEIGAGTGKATEVFARSGLNITCIEPDEAMAAVLSSRRLAGVAVEVSTFEEWPGPTAPVDLVFAAQTWHWLDRNTACSRAMGWLRPGGLLALIWNIPEHRYHRFREVYADHAPHLLEEGDPRINFRDSEVWLDDLADARLGEVGLATYEWSKSLTSAEVRRLYSTYSDHIQLEPPIRERLLDALESEVARFGGAVDFRYQTRVFTGTKPG